MKKYYAEIITIGNEVLAGQTVNTNATFISQKLMDNGLQVYWVTTIRDTDEEIIFALKTASQRADVIIVTGGLGPTPDDITKKSVCNFFNTRLITDKTVLQDVKEFVESRGFKLTDLNRGQALVPETAKILRNPIGTAPALMLEKNNKPFFFLPGVPREMKHLLTEHVIKILTNRLKLPKVHTKMLRTTSIPEAKLYEKLQHVVDKYPQFELGFYPRYFGVDIRFRVQTEDTQVLKEFDNYCKEVKNIVAKYVYSSRPIELEEKLGELLKERSLTLSTAESFTGGLLGDMITNVPGCTEYYLGGAVTYSNESKMQLLAVQQSTLKNYGAVSENTALEMVRGIQDVYQSSCAISTTGIAGPGGATAEKPVGLCYIAARLNDKEMVKKFNFGTERRINKLRGAVAGMEMLRRLLLNI